MTLKPFQGTSSIGGIRQRARAKAASMTPGMRNEASAAHGKPDQLDPSLYDLRPAAGAESRKESPGNETGRESTGK
jgi:hypothetical protein